MASKSSDRDRKLDIAFNKVYALIKKTVVDSMNLIGEDAVKESALRAPIDTGNLRGSHRQEVNVNNDSFIYTEISANTRYAIYMHEWFYNLGPRSRLAGPLVGRKYLWRAVHHNLVKYRRFLRNNIKTSIRRNFRS